ncbi:uncharacterized protein LOC132623310 [Lycium barbarum]|uniref:uncharacterized protein LOC132623310 n=1 Tax=Lycium barbarum TaxID=112863 RepID=UPI00293E32B4|nr:uncharacterized protein LOC132623310 [Lycium barbarum]
MNMELIIPSQTVTLKSTFSLTLHENEERKFLINVPLETLRVAMNIRTYPYTLIHKYGLLMIPTLTEEDIRMAKCPSHPLLAHLEISLAQGGSSITYSKPEMKVLLWNCRGCNNPNFKRNFRALVQWHNPNVICLTETKLVNHCPLLDFIKFTDLFEISADEYSGGVAFMWKSNELEVDPITITSQEIHVNIQVPAPSIGERSGTTRMP